NGIPVGADETGEAQLPLENVREQLGMASHVHAIPAGVGHHDRTESGLDGGDVGSDPVGAHAGLVELHVCTVDEPPRIRAGRLFAGSAVGSLTITREVFGAGDDAGSAAT